MIAKIEQLVSLAAASIQPLPLPTAEQRKYSIDVLRLDKIHSVISGNKWFKLKYSLEAALQQQKNSIVTAGGAYSNHILATASACSEAGMKSIGIIRGERPKELSCTLKKAMEFGMSLDFVPRSIFADREKLYKEIRNNHNSSYLVEEGGKNENGIRGAEEILQLVPKGKYQYICAAVGTGTMLTGLSRASQPHQRIIGISSLKIVDANNDLMEFISKSIYPNRNVDCIYDYHFGGYAKYTLELIEFMNSLYRLYAIPTDFVYTGKLFYAINELVKKSYFDTGATILTIHSGGLQGNCSLPLGTLLF